MCVICFTQDVNISDDYIKKMWDANPDGAGFACLDSKQKKMYYAKGFLKVEELIEALPTKRENIVLHFRIATSGLVNANNCHPFNIDNAQKEEGFAKRLLFHNGVYPITWNVKKKFLEKHSDTYLLCKDILSKINHRNVYDAILSDGNKFALFDANITAEQWLIYGKWEESDGMFFSNLHFNLPKYPVGRWNRKNYVWDEEDYEWMRQFPKTPTVGTANPEVGKVTKSEDDEDEINPLISEIGDKPETYVCDICGYDLDKNDEPFGVCDDCTANHGLYCEVCNSRMVLTNDGGYFCSSGNGCGELVH